MYYIKYEIVDHGEYRVFKVTDSHMPCHNDQYWQSIPFLCVDGFDTFFCIDRDSNGDLNIVKDCDRGNRVYLFGTKEGKSDMICLGIKTKSDDSYDCLFDKQSMDIYITIFNKFINEIKNK